MGAHYPKVVSSPHYHLWTDALHARALAHQARNRWDRGAYVRWTVNTAWTAFEIICSDVLGARGLGNRFKERFDEAIKRLQLSPIEWGSGIWQRILSLYGIRKEYTHYGISQQNLFAEVAVADDAISTIREAIIAIFAKIGITPPTWIEDDQDRGWDDGKDGPLSAHGMVIHQGASNNDPNVVRLTYLVKDREYVRCLLQPGTDPEPHISELLQTIRMPISAIRIYHGNDLVEVRELPMRGV